jgi:hypothetical protein
MRQNDRIPLPLQRCYSLFDLHSFLTSPFLIFPIKYFTTLSVRSFG